MSARRRYPTTREQIRTALADYIASEGCSCCRNREEHTAALARLGKLLGVPMYKDKSGYDFSKFETKVPGVTKVKV